MFDWFKSKKKEDVPDFWEKYVNLFKDPLPKSTPLADVPFIVFDTETTGLNPQRDQILSIGAIRVQNWQISIADRLEVYVHQDYAPASSNIAIHGILPGTSADSLDELDALRSFLAFIGSNVLVGHHVGFDIAMINAALKPRVNAKLKNKRIDTAGMAHRVEPASYHFIKKENFSLDALCMQYNIPIQDRHTAGGDAFLTALLFLKLLARLRSRGVKTLRDLLQ